LADKGGNYRTLKQIIKKYKLDTDILNSNRNKANKEKAIELHRDNKLGYKIPLDDILNGSVNYY